MNPLIPFDYSFIVLISPDLYETKTKEIKLNIEMLQTASESAYVALEAVFETYSNIIDSGALTNGDSSPACGTYEADIIGNENHWVIDLSSPVTPSAIIVFLNLLQQAQGQFPLKQVTITTDSSKQTPEPAKVCAPDESAYSPIPDDLPFEYELDEITDSLSLYIRFEHNLTAQQKESVTNALRAWLVGFANGAYRLDAQGSSDYGQWEDIICVDDDVEWLIRQYQGGQAGIESLVHIGRYLHEAVAPIAELFVD